MHNFKKLDIWINSLEFSKFIYLKTAQFPKEEQFGLTSQMRRSSVSIVSNIAEGSGRGSDKEFIRFLEISITSSFESETQLILSKELNYLSLEYFDKLENKLQSIQKMIFGFKKEFIKVNRS